MRSNGKSFRQQSANHQFPFVTLSAIENLIRAQTGNNRRLHQQAISSKMQELSKNSSKAKAGSNKDLKVLKPIYYFDRSKQCQKKNCFCQFHTFKRPSPISHHYNSVKKQSKMVNATRSNYGNFMSLEDSNQNLQQQSQCTIDNYYHKHTEKYYQQSQIPKNRQLKNFNAKTNKQKIKNELDCKNQEFQNFLRTHDLIILKKTPGLQTNFHSKKMEPRQIFNFLAQRLHFTDKQIKKQLQKIVSDIGQQQYYMRKFLTLKNQAQKVKHRAKSKKSQDNKKITLSRQKLMKAIAQNNHLPKNRKLKVLKNNRMESINNQLIQQNFFHDISEQQLYDIMRKFKKNQGISIQTIKKMIESNMNSYNKNIQKIKQGIREARKNGHKREELSKMINQFVQSVLSQFEKVSQKDFKQKKLGKKSIYLQQFKSKMEKQLNQMQDYQMEGGLSNSLQSIRRSSDRSFHQDPERQRQSGQFIGSHISTNNFKQQQEPEASKFYFDRNNRNSEQKGGNKESLANVKHQNVNKLKMMKKAQYILNSQIGDQSDQFKQSQIQIAKPQPKNMQIKIVPISQSPEKIVSLAPRMGRMMSFFKVGSDVRQTLRKKTTLFSIKEQIKKNRQVITKIQSFLRDNNFEGAIIKDNDSVLTMKRKLRVLREFQQMNRQSLGNIIEQFKCYLKLIEHRCYMGSIRKNTKFKGCENNFQSVFTEQFDFKKQLGQEVDLLGRNLMFYCLKYFVDYEQGECGLHIEGKTSNQNSYPDKIPPVSYIKCKTIKKRATVMQDEEQEDLLIQQDMPDDTLNYPVENNMIDFIQNHRQQIKQYGSFYGSNITSPNLTLNNNKTRTRFQKQTHKNIKNKCLINVGRTKKCFRFIKQNYPIAFSMFLEQSQNISEAINQGNQQNF